MHYVHRLDTRQKKVLITIFVLVPVIALMALFAIWAKKERVFAKTFKLKAVISSAQGVSTQTNITFSGIKVGNISELHLNDDNQIEVTLKIEEAYHKRIHKDAEATLGSIALFGLKEFRIAGGSKELPPITANNFITIVPDDIKLEGIMDRINPIIAMAEKTISKISNIINSFPNKKLNDSMTSVAEILKKIKNGESTVGKLVVTDKAEFYNHLNKLIKRLDIISADVEKASKHFPGTLKNTKELLGSASVITTRIADTSKDLNVDEIQKILLDLLRNINVTAESVSKLAPTLNTTTETVGEMAEEFKQVAPRIPVILDDVEMALSETLILIQSVKTAWPVKNLVPESKEKPAYGSSLRKSPYNKVKEK